MSTHRLSRPIFALFSKTIAVVKFQISLLLSVTQKNKIDRLIRFCFSLYKTVKRLGIIKKNYILIKHFKMQAKLERRNAHKKLLATL